MKHLVIFTDLKVQLLLNGQLKYDVRFFKKKAEFLNKLSIGDVIFIRKGNEVIGQFEVGKIVLIENLEASDWSLVKTFENSLTKEIFEIKAQENSTLVIIQISNLEQFITSPIEINKRNKKEWVVMED